MSQQGSPFSTQTVFGQPEVRTSNGMGTAGFIISLVAILGSCCSCFFPAIGLLALLGLVLSFMAVFRQPRGLAITGIILSAIALILSIVGLLGWIGGKSVGGMVHIVKANAIAQIANDQRNATGSYPADLSAFGSQLPPWFTTDKWGNSFVYEVSADGSEFTVRSMGPDGVDNTGDDVLFQKDMVNQPGYTPDRLPQDGTVPDLMPDEATPDTAPEPG